MMLLVTGMGDESDDEQDSDSESDEEESTQASDDNSSEQDESEQEEPPTTVIVITIHNEKTGRNELFRVLLDSGTNRCLGTAEALKRAGITLKQGNVHRYKTAAGTFITSQEARIRRHRILELQSQRQLQNLRVQVHKDKLGLYDFIFGRDYMTRYGINLMFGEKVIQWDGMRMPMKSVEDVQQTLTNYSEEIYADLNGEMSTGDPCSVIEEMWESHAAQQIMDSKYDKMDTLRVAKDQKHLSEKEQEQLYNLFQEYTDLFEGKLGEWPDEEVDVQLRADAVPYHCGKPIRIPHVHLETLKKEVQRLCDIGVLEAVSARDAGPWCAPSFIIPKKDGTPRFITDYRMVNRMIHRRPWPMPHIADLLQDVGTYKYVTALDLSMGYYHFRLSEQLSRMSTFMLPFGLYRYKRMAMGLSISPDFFQEKLSQLFSDLPYIKIYLDDLLIFSNGTYEDHLKKVHEVLRRLHEKNLAVNARKSYWAVDEVDYLGFRLTRQGVKPQAKKIAALMNMEAPRNKRTLRRLIGMVNYYRYMWKKRSHIMAPLTELISKNVPFKWEKRHQKSLEELKQMIGHEVLLSFPDYTQPFQLYTDASDLQMGAVLMQGKKTLAFFSKKLNKAQRNYGVGEKEMLSTVEALKEFHTMIYGYPIDVYTDHKNWTHDKAMRNARVIRWRLLMQDYNPTIHYVPGEKNIVADALSRNAVAPYIGMTKDNESALVEEIFDMRNWRRFYQPLTIKEIGRAQAKDKYLKQLQEKTPDKLGDLFEDIGQQTGPDKATTIYNPVDKQYRIVVPQELTKRLMEWYHTTLVHPGVHRLYNTLRQHYTWPKMLSQIRAYLRTCGPCQRGKRGGRGYGKVPLKDVETEPWKDIALDLAGPWKAVVDGKDVLFHTLTIIDVFTGWVEIIPITRKKKEVIRDLFVQEWLRRYPRPSRVIYDAGGEFDNDEFAACCTTWYIKPEPITVKNPRANAIVERMHQVLGDMLRVQLAARHGEEDPIKELTSAAAYGIRATVHGVTQYTPSQLIYNRDLILRTRIEADIELARQRREKAVYINNQRENRRRIKYHYKKGDRVLILSGGMDPKLQLHHGPFKVLSYNKASGTLHIKRRHYVEPINIRNVRPYFGRKKPT